MSERSIEPVGTLRCLLFGHPEAAYVPYVDSSEGEAWVEINCPRCGKKRALFESFSDLNSRDVVPRER